MLFKKAISPLKSLEVNKKAIFLDLIATPVKDGATFDISALLNKSNQYLVMNGGFQPIKWIEFVKVNLFT